MTRGSWAFGVVDTEVQPKPSLSVDDSLQEGVYRVSIKVGQHPAEQPDLLTLEFHRSPAMLGNLRIGMLVPLVTVNHINKTKTVHLSEIYSSGIHEGKAWVNVEVEERRMTPTEYERYRLTFRAEMP